MDKLPTRDELLHHFYEHWHPHLGTEVIPIAKAVGRICAKSYLLSEVLPLTELL